jgi:hypothetical protein
MSSTTLSVYPLARMRSKSQIQIAASGSNASALLGQRREELDREERIAAGLLVHQLRQRMGDIPLAVQSIIDQPADIFQHKRREHDFLNP